MSERLFLHVGLPKSATSYVQNVLGTNKRRLRERDRLLFPGAEPGDWQRLMDEVHAWSGDSIISMEWLCGADPEVVRRMVDSASPAKVSVIITARDLGRTIPAAWQEFVQNNEIWTWREFLGAITADDPMGTPPGRLFWTQQDLGTVLATWGDAVPPERMQVITVPAHGAVSSGLWERFAGVLGIDPAAYDATGSGANESLGLQSTELMLRVNRACRAAGLDRAAYDEVIKHAFAKRGLSRLRHGEDVLTVPADLRGWVDERADQLISAVAASGAQVVGDLEELRPSWTEPDDGAAPDLSADRLLDAALEALVTLARDRHEWGVRLRSGGTTAEPDRAG